MRSFSFARTAAAILAATTCCTMQAVSAAQPPSIDDALRQIEAYAPQALQEQGAPGMSLAITDRTHTLRILTLGYANLDAKTPVTASTRFPIGSITKGMTALALMQLHDEGRFDPARPVRTYLPWFSIASGGKTIYAHQLLSHTGGTPDDFSFSPGYMFSVADLRNAHTIFTPGTSWSYSNDGLATTGAILETLDGRPWAQSLQTRVFDALGDTVRRGAGLRLRGLQYHDAAQPTSHRLGSGRFRRSRRIRDLNTRGYGQVYAADFELGCERRRKTRALAIKLRDVDDAGPE
jgi:CubicO group peptidase (beta-lactamase class C family)